MKENVLSLHSLRLYSRCVFLLVAVDYDSKYDILKGLLGSYGEAAHIRRQLVAKTETSNIHMKRQTQPAEYALAIFEEGRGAKVTLDTEMTHGEREEDFDLRSDLIFVYNPNVMKTELPYFPTYYREETDRIERLKSVIRREAMQNCMSTSDGTADIELTEMAQLAWCWLCSNDEYADVVYRLLDELPTEAVVFLTLVKNPKSLPSPNTPIRDCSSSRNAFVMKARLSFLGRYEVNHKMVPLHKSDTAVVLEATDIGLMDIFLAIQNLLNEDEPDIDDYSHASGSVYGIKRRSIQVNMFLKFCEKLGIDSPTAIREVEEMLQSNQFEDDASIGSQKIGGDLNLKEHGVKKAVFDAFCKVHGIDDKGCRHVAIKFMNSARNHELEVECRQLLKNHTVPLLREFHLENDAKSARDLFGEERQFFDLSVFKYGIVMPIGRDLGDILYREGMSSTNLRESARQIGEALHELHQHGV